MRGNTPVIQAFNGVLRSFRDSLMDFPERTPTMVSARNRGLALAITGLQVLQLIVLPVWFLRVDPAFGWLLLFPVLLSNTCWAFIL